MTRFSKYFSIAIHDKSCGVIHPGYLCDEFAKKIYCDAIKGCTIWFLPVYMLPVLLNRKKWSKSLWWDKLTKLMKIIFLGPPLTCIIIIKSVCYIWPTFKQNDNLLILIPVLNGFAMSAIFLPNEFTSVQGLGGLNMIFDFCMRITTNKFLLALKESKLFAITSFMLASSVIAYSFKISNIRKFWFFGLPKSDKSDMNVSAKVSQASPIMDKIMKSTHHVCGHRDTCDKYIFKEIKSSASFGLMLASLKVIPSLVRNFRQNPTILPQLIIKKFDYKILLFCISYTGIFKILNCFLNRYRQKNSLSNAVLSAFVSGISYSINPKLLIWSFGTFTALHLLWLTYMNSDRKKPKILQFINNLPLAKIFYSVEATILGFIRITYPYETPKYVHKYFGFASRRNIDRISQRYSEILMG